MTQGIFSARTLFLCAAASVLGQSILGNGPENSARVLLLWGTPAALALCLLAALFAAEAGERGLFEGPGIFCWLGRMVFALWFAVELVQTLWAAQTVCWTQFGSMAVFSAVPLLLWAGWAIPDRVFDRSAVVLFWLAVGGVLLCMAGLWGQLAWPRLLAEPAKEFAFPQLPVFAEYFALPLLCLPQEQKKAFWLPLGVFAVQAGDCLLGQLLFGAGALVARVELLRAAAVGGVSRMDAVFLLLWLAVAFFRVCVLTRALRLLWERRRTAPAEGQVEG